ncbi:ComEA family DNA-binding protein [Corynebacterium sp. A21]|uniref:ComEA family DNA-binding protein n=1 Tax=Corynebacterium sp. A21 TaxID=3457318 RepID=UPI003FD4C9AA
MTSIVDRLREFTRPTGEESLMDVAYPTPRFRVGLREAAVVTVILLVALVGWVGFRALADPPPSGEAVLAGQNLIPGTPGPAGGADESTGGFLGGPAASSTAEPEEKVAEEVVVSVVGEVAHPGLVTLAPGARVADALAVAVPLPGAELRTLNHAQRLNDGEQINVLVDSPGEVLTSGVIGGAPDPGTSETTPAGGISLNKATQQELMELDGVGEKTAAAILAYREQIGGFTAIEQLQEVKGIGPAKFAAIQDLVTL